MRVYFSYWPILSIIISLSLITSATSLFAEVEGCTIGDLTEGEWVDVPIGKGECPVSGQKAADSLWPRIHNINPWPHAYAIIGRYKITANVGTGYYMGSVPPECDLNDYGPGYKALNCIDGYAEAAASIHTEMCNNDTNEYVSCEAQGDIVEVTSRSQIETQGESTSYYRWCSFTLSLAEWHCNNETLLCPKCNLGWQCSLPRLK